MDESKQIAEARNVWANISNFIVSKTRNENRMIDNNFRCQNIALFLIQNNSVCQSAGLWTLWIKTENYSIKNVE